MVNSRMAIVFIVFAFCISCKKTPAIKRNDSIVFGATPNMNIYIKNDTICRILSNMTGCIGEDHYDIDFNKDGVNDIRFISEVWGGQGLGFHPRSSIMCLTQNCMINGFKRNDTTYLSINNYKYGYDSLNSCVRIIKGYSYSCHLKDKRYSIFDIQLLHFNISPEIKGTNLSLTNIFKSDTLMLVEDNGSNGGMLFSECQNDTSISYASSFDYSCWFFPSNTIMYIGIKLISNNVEMLGWIKVSISNYNKITVLEYALQK